MLKAINLSKNIGDRNLFKLSFEILKGDFVSIKGVNGSGKSMLSKILAGIESYDGELYFKGNKIDGINPAIHLVFQDVAQSLNSYMSPYEILEEPYLLGRCSKETLDRYSKLITNRLSHGQKARLAIFRAILSQPEIIILDESLSSLDSNSLNEILDLLKGKTVLFVSHDSNLDKYCNKVIDLNN